MKHFVIIALLFTTISSQCQINKVVIISIDGLRPVHYLETKWPTPTLQRLSNMGIFAEEVKSVFPALTYPSHAAMVTGHLPRSTGVQFNLSNQNDGSWNWRTSSINCETIWQLCSKKGLRTASIQWPISVGTEITYNVPEVWSLDHPEDRISESRKYSTPGLLDEIETSLGLVLDSSSMNEHSHLLDINSARIAGYILAQKKPDLLAVHFAGVDHAQHKYGLDHGEVCEALSSVDSCISHILQILVKEGLDKSTILIITGDHGFSNIHTAIRPNVILKENGIEARFKTAGGTALLYPFNDFDSTDEYAVRIALNRLPDSIQKVLSIIDRPSLNSFGVDSNVAFALSAEPGFVFSQNDTARDLIVVVTGGHHGYPPSEPCMMTGFIAYNPRFRHEKIKESMSLVDLMPIMSKFLKLSAASNSGKLPRVFFRY